MSLEIRAGYSENSSGFNKNYHESSEKVYSSAFSYFIILNSYSYIGDNLNT